MIADDHAILRSGVRLLIEGQEDMELVGEAEDGDKAVECAEQTQPDVVLLDIAMPGEGGIRTIGRIREVSPDSRIVILTMHDDHAYLRSALASGATGYMVKTGADCELLEAIRAVARGKPYIDSSLGQTSVDDALAKLDRAGRPIAHSTDALSSREKQVLELVAYGHTHKEIAGRLEVSVKSVETYRARVADKLGLRSRAELVRYALDHGMLGPDRAPNA